jgi:hypothetical protein
MAEVPLCKDCRYVETRGKAWHSWECHHPKALKPGGINPVTGDPTDLYGRSCPLMRSAIFECGPEGNLWESREDQPRGFV